MNIHISDEKNEFQKYFFELGIDFNSTKLTQMHRLHELDFAIIVGNEDIAEECIAKIRKAHFDAFIVHVYQDSKNISKILSSGANDTFDSKFMDKTIVLSRIQTWLDAVRYRKSQINGLDFQGSNLFNASVWPITSSVKLEHNVSLKFLEYYFENDVALNKDVSNLQFWIYICLKLASNIVQAGWYKSTMFFEENKNFRFLTVKNLPIDNKIFFESLVAELHIDKIKSVNYIVKRSSGKLSLYIKKYQPLSHIKKQVVADSQKTKPDIHLNQILRTSIGMCTDTAMDYLREAHISNDDILEFEEIENECKYLLEDSLTLDDQVKIFANFFNSYASILGKLVEFKNLQSGIYEVGRLINQIYSKDEALKENILNFAALIKQDLYLWRMHIFILKDAQNIHYLDAALLANCLQIEKLIFPDSTTHDYGNDIEFF